jgi:hypothetical protein
MGRYLDRIDALTRHDPFANTQGYEKNEISPVDPQLISSNSFISYILCETSGPLWSALAELEHRRPEYVPADRWQQCLTDSCRFLAAWGKAAEALGWSAKDLFGLIDVPNNPHPSFSRLSRYDELGLCWLIDGGRVLAITEDAATIETRGRAPLRFYRLTSAC